MAKKRKETNISETVQIPCAYCDGKGVDPFGIPSPRSKCQVCGGRGKVNVDKHNMKCAFCDGTGVYPDKRMTCTVCNGKGVVKALKNPVICPSCEGTGVSRDTPGLYCMTCKGRGVVEK